MLEIKKIDGSLVEIKGEIEASIFEATRAEALKKLAQNLKIDGFRKGSVPSNLAQKHLEPILVLEKMAEIALGQAYPKIIKENNIDAMGYPKIHITKLAVGNPLGFTITVAIMPEIKLPDYKNIASVVNKEVLPEGEKEDPKNQNKKRLKIIEKLIEKSEFEIPEVVIESEIDRIIHQMRHDIEKMGLKYDDYLKKINKTEVETRADFKKDAEKRTRLQFIVSEIARVENLKAPKDKVEAEVKKVTEIYKDADPNQARGYIESVLQNEEVFQFLEAQK